MSAGTDRIWKRLVNVPASERAHILQLLRFHEIETRAPRATSLEYEASALATAWEIFEAEIEVIADRMEQTRRRLAGPFLGNVPVEPKRHDQVDIPLERWADVTIESPVWATGALEAVDPQDDRRRALYRDVEYSDAGDGPSSDPATPAVSSPPPMIPQRGGARSGKAGAPIASVVLALVDMPIDDLRRSTVASVQAMLKAAYEVRGLVAPAEDNLRKDASGLRREVWQRAGIDE